MDRISLATQQRTSSLVQQLRAAERDLEGSRTPPSSLIIVTCVYEQLPAASLFFPTSTEIWQKIEGHARHHGRFDATAAAALATSRTSRLMEARTQQHDEKQPWMVLSTTHAAAPFVVHAELLRKVMLEAPPHCVVEAGAARPGGEFWAAWDALKVPRELLPAQEAARSMRDAGPNGRVYGSRQPGFPGELLRPLPSTPIIAKVDVMADV
jgi:hypothetical protein